MKKAGVCPKCEGADIVRVPGGIRSTMDSTQNFVTCGFRSAPLYLLWVWLFRGMAAGGRF